MTHSSQLKRVIDLTDDGRRQYARQTPAREAFLSQINSGLIACSCMDARGNFPLLMGLPMGVVQEFRRGGAMVDHASSGFRERLRSMVRRDRHRPDIFFQVVHSSQHSPHACGAWRENGGLAAAITHSRSLAVQNELAHEGELYTVIMCHHTDDDTFAVYEEASGKLHRICALPVLFGNMAQAVARIFPQFPRLVASDLTEIFNRHRHYASTRSPLMESAVLNWHVEDTIMVGERFACVGRCKQIFVIDEKCGGAANQMLIAVSIIKESLAEGRIVLGSADRLLVMTQVPWDIDDDPELNRKNRKCAAVGALAQAARLERIFRDRFPELVPHLEVQAATISDRYDLDLCDLTLPRPLVVTPAGNAFTPAM